METEIKEILQLILQKFDSIDRTFESIDKKFDSIDKKFETIDKKIDLLDKNFQAVNLRLDNIENRIINLEVGQANIVKRQEELYSVVKAIEHRTEYNSAEVDDLQLKVAKLEGLFNKIGKVVDESKAV